MQKFSKKEAITYGWNTMKQNFMYFLGLLAIIMAVSLLSNYAIASFENSGDTLMIFVVSIISVMVNVLIGMGIIHLMLQVHDGKKSPYKDITVPAPLFFRYLGASIIYGIIILLGLILLIVPGIIWALKYGQYKYLIIDKNLGVFESIHRSGEITKGAKWDLFLLGVLLGLINLLGALVLLIGLVATIPLSWMAVVYAYRKMLSATPASSQIETDNS